MSRKYGRRKSTLSSFEETSSVSVNSYHLHSQFSFFYRVENVFRKRDFRNVDFELERDLFFMFIKRLCNRTSGFLVHHFLDL